jgi:hypothetical protein
MIHSAGGFLMKKLDVLKKGNQHPFCRWTVREKALATSQDWRQKP